MDVKKPMTEEDYLRLDEFQLSDESPEGCLLADEIHGLLTAVICGPGVVMPSEYMEMIWGGEEPEFESMERAEEIIGFLLRMHNDISATFRGREPFVPLLLERPGDEGDILSIAERWCFGFLQGMALRADLWIECAETDLKHLLFPIMVLGVGEHNSQVASWLSQPGTGEKLTNLLPDAVMAIYIFWREHGPDFLTQESRWASRKSIGGDDPCPCGSGKKYKDCCGAPQTLH